MAKRINTSTFVEVINEDGDDRFIINKDKIAYIDEIDDDGCCVNFVNDDNLSLDVQQMKQLFDSMNEYT